MFYKLTSKHDADVYYLNCLHSFSTENKFKDHEMYVKIMIISI